MPKGRGQRSAQRDFKHTWFVKEWMDSLDLRQRDLIEKLGWSRAKASEVYNGQKYTQELIDDLLTVMPGLEPYELLMRPDEAMALRRMKAAAFTIVRPDPKTDPAETAKMRKKAS